MKVDIFSPEAAGKYAVIYADPPWSYNQGGHGAATNHYNTMTPKAIKELPVEALAAKDAVLFMWATFPNLPQALDTIRAWGFKYKTLAFNWVKFTRGGVKLFWGLGFWTRSNPEVCLLAVKGKPKRVSASVHSVIMSPIERHSKKPAETRDRIVQLMGDVPRVELFARESSEGWDCWGNEV